MNRETEESWTVASVETPEWKSTVGVAGDNVHMKLTLQGDFDLTWAEKGDLVLTTGYYESLELPHLLRLIATALEEMRLMSGGLFET